MMYSTFKNKSSFKGLTFNQLRLLWARNKAIKIRNRNCMFAHELRYFILQKKSAQMCKRDPHVFKKICICEIISKFSY